MPESSDQPILPGQTTAQNEAVETVLRRMEDREIFVPAYQRDSDEWDEDKKSLFIESILNRLTVPAFYLAPSEEDADRFEVVDGQQRLTTLIDFYSDRFRLLPDDKCQYFGAGVQYAGTKYSDLHEQWQRSFRRYNLNVVTLPPNMPLNLRLEIFRRINQGGTPLSGQDIRLSYYSESSAVRFIQLAGIYDPARTGSKRMIDSSSDEIGWPWESTPNAAKMWYAWWSNTRTAIGQTSSEMFLWYVIARNRSSIDRLLNNRNHLTTNLALTFRNNTDEVLDIVCAELRFEDRNPETPRLFPDATLLRSEYFEEFQRWWTAIRSKCYAQVQVGRHRSVALLIPGLVDFLRTPEALTDDQWGWVGKFVSLSRATAGDLSVTFPESKGRWTGERGQRAQINAYFEVAGKIASK